MVPSNSLHQHCCTLCRSRETEELFRSDRHFWKCLRCQLIFVLPEFHLGHEEERSRYETHRNSPEDDEYRNFLNRLADPLVRRLPLGSAGLDFGSGPGPTLAVMLEEKGFEVQNFDPYFAPREDLLQDSYDFITCTETAEHFNRPEKEFLLLDRLLRQGGWLGIMTQMIETDEAFPEWYYHRDPTHVSFYRRDTMEWISRWRGWRVEYPAKNIVLFNKATGTRHERTVVQ